MAGYTPGPWAVEDPMGRDIGFWIVQDGLPTYEWSCIATVHYDDAEARKDGGRRFISKAEQTVNARLIAASTQLYEACEAALEVCEHSHIRSILRAALSSASGE